MLTNVPSSTGAAALLRQYCVPLEARLKAWQLGSALHSAAACSRDASSLEHEMSLVVSMVPRNQKMKPSRLGQAPGGSAHTDPWVKAQRVDWNGTQKVPWILVGGGGHVGSTWTAWEHHTAGVPSTHPCA